MELGSVLLSERQRAIVHAGALSPLFGLLGEGSSDGCREAAASTIANLAACEATELRAVVTRTICADASGALTALIALLRSRDCSPEVRLEAARALRLLATETDETDETDGESVAAVARALGLDASKYGSTELGDFTERCVREECERLMNEHGERAAADDVLACVNDVLACVNDEATGCATSASDPTAHGGYGRHGDYPPIASLISPTAHGGNGRHGDHPPIASLISPTAHGGNGRHGRPHRQPRSALITLRLLPSSGDLIVSAARPSLDETPSAGSLHVRVARACVEALCRASLPGSAADSWTRAQLCLWRVALLGSCPMDARELLEGLQELDTQVESALTMLNTTLDTAASASAEPDSRETATARDGAARYGATAAATRSGARDGALATLAAASLALDQLIQGARDGARDGAVNESNLKLVLDGLARTAGSLTAGSLTAGSLTAGSLTAGSLTAGSLTAESLTAGSLTAGSLTAGSLTAESLTAESFEERRRPAINTAISTAINTAGRASARFLSVLVPELVSSAAAEVSSAAAEVSSAAAEVSSAAAEVSSRPVVSSTAEDVSGLAERLMSDMCELFREYADEAGHVGRHELIEIGSAPRFAELSAKTALLGRVDLSCSGPLGAHDDARLAFWLNVYNLICMQGFAANARQVPCSESTLAVLRMHSSFVHNIGGFSISAIEIEHAILRASKPRPSFFIAFLIPKFGSNDPRRALAFSSIPSPLISFGLVAGTVFSPPLRAYTAGAVHTQLALNARAVLAMTIEVLDTTPSSSTCRFPRWHASAHHGATSLFPTGARPDALPAPPVAPRAAPLAPRRRGRLRARRTHRPGAPPAAAAAHRGAPRSLLGRRARDGARDGGQDAVEQHVMARALRVCARRRGVCMSTYEREISERCLDSRGAWSCRRVQPTARTTPATRRAASPCLPPRVRSSQSAYLF